MKIFGLQKETDVPGSKPINTWEEYANFHPLMTCIMLILKQQWLEKLQYVHHAAVCCSAGKVLLFKFSLDKSSTWLRVMCDFPFCPKIMPEKSHFYCFCYEFIQMLHPSASASASKSTKHFCPSVLLAQVTRYRAGCECVQAMESVTTWFSSKTMLLSLYNI